MAKIVWDKIGEKKFEAGVSKGVYYPLKAETGKYEGGVAWNGLTSVSEAPTGAEVTDLWADDIKYGSLRSAENYAGSVEAYMAPDEFMAADGYAEVVEGAYIGQQDRAKFGMSYVTQIGSDTITLGSGKAYKIHLVWGMSVSPSDRTHNTVNDNPEAETMSWEYTCDPVNVTGHKPTASMTIDSTKVDAGKLAELEKKLYGDETSGVPTLPTPDEVIQILTTT